MTALVEWRFTAAGDLIWRETAQGLDAEETDVLSALVNDIYEHATTEQRDGFVRACERGLGPDGTEMTWNGWRVVRCADLYERATS